MWVMDWSKWKEGDDYPAGIPLWKYSGEPIGRVSEITDCCGGLMFKVDMVPHKKFKKKEKKKMFGRKARRIRKLEDDCAELNIQYENVRTFLKNSNEYGEKWHREAIRLNSEIEKLNSKIKFLEVALDASGRCEIIWHQKAVALQSELDEKIKGLEVFERNEKLYHQKVVELQSMLDKKNRRLEAFERNEKIHTSLIEEKNVNISTLSRKIEELEKVNNKLIGASFSSIRN